MGAIANVGERTLQAFITNRWRPLNESREFYRWGTVPALALHPDEAVALRKAGKLTSIKIGGVGMWLTSEEEVERIESVPPQTPAPQGAVKNRDAA
jgi:hypothetical protein